MDALNRSGLLRYLQPKVWGGMELAVRRLLRHSGDAFARRHRRSAGSSRTSARITATSRGGTAKAQEEVWGREPRRGHRVRHRVPAGPRRARGRRHHALRRMEFLFGHRSLGLEHARLHRARRREADRLRVVPAASLAIRGRRRLADARHARDQQQDRALQRCLRAATSRAVHVRREAGRSFVARPCRASAIRTIAFPTSALGGHCIGAVWSAMHAPRSRRRIALVKSRSTNYTGASMRDFQTVQLRIAHRGREDRCGGARAPQRLPRSAAHLRRRRHRSTGNAAALQAQLRDGGEACASKRWTRCTRWPARTASTTLSAAAHVSRSACRRRPFQFQYRCAAAAVGPGRARRRIQEPDDVNCV